MQRFGGVLTIGASPVRIATVYTPCAKLFFQMRAGGTGIGYVGGPSVAANGNNADIELAAASASAPGASETIESHEDANVLDASQYYVIGSNPGDTVGYEYHQN